MPDAIKAKTDALAQVSMKLGEAMYKAQAGAGEAGGDEPPPSQQQWRGRGGRRVRGGRRRPQEVGLIRKLARVVACEGRPGRKPGRPARRLGTDTTAKVAIPAMAKRDYYDLLGLNRSASEADIKNAYRQMAKQYHPDRNPGDKAAEARFKEVNEAYEVLRDPQKKAAYDQFGHQAFEAGMAGGRGGGAGAGFDFTQLRRCVRRSVRRLHGRRRWPGARRPAARPAAPTCATT